MKSIKSSITHLLGFITVAVLLTGCRSTPPLVEGSNRMAAVVIERKAPEEIGATVKSVFLSHGYQPGRSYGKEMVFQKKGGFVKSALHGDWYSGAVWTRIIVYQRELEAGRTLVDCDLYLVQGPEDPFFETAQKHKGRSSECQKLLDEVRKQLGSLNSKTR